MTRSVTPMIHVPDVRATIEWYESVGFTVVDTNEDHGEIDWAMLSFGNGRVMFNTGGRPSSDVRREVDLYVHTDDVDALYARLAERVEVLEGLHNTFYGAREFIVRDVNGYWVTFGQDLGEP